MIARWARILWGHRSSSLPLFHAALQLENLASGGGCWRREGRERCRRIGVFWTRGARVRRSNGEDVGAASPGRGGHVRGSCGRCLLSRECVFVLRRRKRRHWNTIAVSTPSVASQSSGKRDATPTSGILSKPSWRNIVLDFPPRRLTYVPPLRSVHFSPAADRSTARERTQLRYPYQGCQEL